MIWLCCSVAFEAGVDVETEWFAPSSLLVLVRDCVPCRMSEDQSIPGAEFQLNVPAFTALRSTGSHTRACLCAGCLAQCLASAGSATAHITRVITTFSATMSRFVISPETGEPTPYIYELSGSFLCLLHLSPFHSDTCWQASIGRCSHLT